jgi:hypothetical protein
LGIEIRQLRDMSVKFEDIPLFEHDEETGSLIINIDSDAANADWIRASRLLKKGDKKSLAELAKLSNTKMKRIVNK